jgi:hypothetical protein
VRLQAAEQASVPAPAAAPVPASALLARSATRR